MPDIPREPPVGSRPDSESTLQGSGAVSEWVNLQQLPTLTRCLGHDDEHGSGAVSKVVSLRKRAPVLSLWLQVLHLHPHLPHIILIVRRSYSWNT